MACNLELRTTIEALADDLAAFPSAARPAEAIERTRVYANRYPLA